MYWQCNQAAWSNGISPMQNSTKPMGSISVELSTGVRVIDVQSDDGSVSHDVNNSAPILPFWIAVVIDTPGGILEGVVHKDLHKTVRLIPWQMKVMQQVNKSIDIYGDNIGQHPESRLCYADSAMPCHGMLADSAWSVPGVNLASKKTRTATSRNS